jgi:GNAT superfamily N-acetyltransferase
MSESTRFWREGLQALHERYPDKPVLVSEFGYAALEGVHGSAFGEDTQAAAIEAEFAGMDAPYVCGATIWCWADHAWPAATFGYCRYLATSPYGVVSRERRKLKAYGTVKKLFRQKQGIAEPAQAAARGPGAAGHPLIMIRPHMEDIPQVPFPEGYDIRPMRLDEGALWTDIWRDAEEYFGIDDTMFARNFAYDLQATQWRSFIITNSRGVGVGTISAWYNRRFRGQDYGQVHWVAVRQAYQGLGLGKAGLSFVLRQLAQWHDRCYLGTQSKRLPAISLYLNFGLLPDLEDPGEIEGWREVKRGLKHPVLEAMEEL